MNYVKMAVKDLGHTVKNNLDTNSHHATSGQLNYIKIIGSSLIFQQIKTFINGPLNQRKKCFLGFLNVTQL